MRPSRWAELIARDRRPPAGPTYDYRADRPGRRPGRRRAGRQHPRRLPLPHRPRPLVRRPAGRHRDDRDARRSRPGRAAADLQPGPHRPDQPGLQPTAASRWSASSGGDDETFFVVANHFNSKGGDDPLFGRFQPPIRGSEVQRHQQAAVVHALRRCRSWRRIADAQRHRARRPQRLRVLARRSRSSRAMCSTTLIETCCRSASATPMSSRATRRRSTTCSSVAGSCHSVNSTRSRQRGVRRPDRTTILRLALRSHAISQTAVLPWSSGAKWASLRFGELKRPRLDAAATPMQGGQIARSSIKSTPNAGSR